MRTTALVAVAVFLATTASAQIAIDFDDLPPDAVVTTQYPPATFVTVPGYEIRTVGAAALFGSSVPNVVCTGPAGGAITCDQDLAVVFSRPVSGLAFLADGVDTNGPAAFAEVFFPGGSYGRAVNGVGVGSTPTVVLFNQYPNVTALQLYGITDPGGIAWDDFEFHFEYWTPYWWDLESHPGGMAPDLAYPGGSNGEWEWGVATYPPEVAAHSGQKVWGTDLDGSAYDGSPNSHVLRWQDVTLDGQPGALWSLEWWDWYGGDGFLDGRVVKVDDGSSTTDVFEGTDDQRLWQRHEISLAPWAGQTVDILFVLGTCCGTTPSDGWYLDDVKITDASFVFVDGFEDGSTSAWQ